MFVRGSDGSAGPIMRWTESTILNGSRSNQALSSNKYSALIALPHVSFGGTVWPSESVRLIETVMHSHPRPSNCFRSWCHASVSSLINASNVFLQSASSSRRVDNFWKWKKVKPRRCLLHGRVIRDGPSAICVKVNIRPTDLSPEHLSMNSCSNNKSDLSTTVGDLMLSGGAKRLRVNFFVEAVPKMIETMLPRDERNYKNIRRFGLMWMNRNISESGPRDLSCLPN